MTSERACSVRPIHRDRDEEIDLVAARMRLTLIEVLGEEQGASMYDMPWLRARVKWHLDEHACTGEVFVAESASAIVGHTIVRLEPHQDGPPTGLFSTIYVAPEARRRGVAEALVAAGEAWLSSRGMTALGTSTSASNHRLIALFEKRGFRIVLSLPEKRMVHLEKRISPAP